MVKKILVAIVAMMAVGAGIAIFVRGSKRMRMRRAIRRAGRMICSVGSMICNESCCSTQ